MCVLAGGRGVPRGKRLGVLASVCVDSYSRWSKISILLGCLPAWPSRKEINPFGRAAVWDRSHRQHPDPLDPARETKGAGTTAKTL